MKKLCLQIGINTFLRFPDAMTMEDVMLILEQAEIVNGIGNSTADNCNLGIKYIDVKSLDSKKEAATTGTQLSGDTKRCCIVEADEAIMSDYPVAIGRNYA